MEENIQNDDDILKRIESSVFDENKIVTYKWLSRTSNIHPDAAKRYLSQFFHDHSKKDSISASFIIGGLAKTKIKDVKVHKICIVSEKDISKAKQMFQEVSFEHIYGVQQGSNCDLNSLYAADYVPCDALLKHLSRWQVIQCENARHRTEEEMRKLKIPFKTTGNQKPSLKVTKIATTANPNLKSTSVPLSEEKRDNEASKTKIPDMFLKQPGTKKPTSRNEIKSEPDSCEKPQGSASTIKKGSMTSYFTKEGTKSKNVVAMEISQESKSNGSNITRQKQTNKKPSDNSGQSSFATPTSRKTRLSPKNTNTNSSSGSSDFQKPKKTAKPLGKHKRIMTISSSESESEEEEEIESESPFPPGPSADDQDEEPMETDSEEPIPPTPPVHNVCTQRKLVTETYEDENGFLVTKKVWKNVTEVETEPQTPSTDKTSSATTTPCDTSKEDKPKKQSSKISPPSGSKKQASLMSFFKKKEVNK